MRLAFSEPFLTLNFKDGRDRYARARDDFLVGIDKIQPEAPRKSATHRALARARHADEVDVFEFAH